MIDGKYMEWPKLQARIAASLVTDAEIESCLTGEALAPYLAAEAECAALLEQEPTPERDERLYALQTQYPYLVDPEDGSTTEERRPAVTVDVAGWKRANYALLRAAHYPPATDYLDAVVKDDATAIQAYKDACLLVKARFPKPEAV